MSLKATLSHNNDYHLYEDCFDQKDIVHLRIDNPVSLQMDYDNQRSSGGNVTVTIPIEVWRHVVEGWLSTKWAQNPDWDHRFEGGEDGG